MRKKCKIQTYEKLKIPEGACAKSIYKCSQPFLIGDLQLLFGEKLESEIDNLNEQAHQEEMRKFRQDDYDEEDYYDEEEDY